MNELEYVEFMQAHFKLLAKVAFSSLKNSEEASLSLHGEKSHFIRFNQAKVRQNTSVTQHECSLRLRAHQRSAEVHFQLTGTIEQDRHRLLAALASLREDLAVLPEDPFLSPLPEAEPLIEVYDGDYLPTANLTSTLNELTKDFDLAGLYGAGPLCSGAANSKGLFHWFASDFFFFDYSLFKKEKAVKGVYSGRKWNSEELRHKLSQESEFLHLLDRPPIRLKPGPYRSYLAPEALSELMHLINWGALSQAAFQKGHSPFISLIKGEQRLSPQIYLTDNLTLGTCPRFNSLGEVAPSQLSLIENGKIANLLTSSRSSLQYGAPSTGANASENPRSLDMQAGDLQKNEILTKLSKGLYVSNLHYGNWSNQMSARATGMTRYACFWVENGEVVAPIEDLRFDDSFYNILGKNLEAITNFRSLIPNMDTYDHRNWGAQLLPGILLSELNFTL